jgi:hypothetical protein
MRERRLSLTSAFWTAFACLLLLPGFATATSHAQDLIRKHGSGLRVVARNLDHAGPTARVRCWTIPDWARRYVQHRSARSRVAFRLVISEAHHYGIDDGTDDSADTNTATEFAPLTSLLCPLPRAPDLVASRARICHTAPAYRSFTPVDPFLPRPPPADISL